MKKIIYLIINITFLFNGLYSNENNNISKINASITKAEEFIDKEMYNSAIVILQQTLTDYTVIFETQPVDTIQKLLMDIQYLIGYANYHTGNHDEAISVLYDVIKNPSSTPYYKVKSYIGLGNVFASRGRISSAEESLKSALEIQKAEKFDNKVLLRIYNNLSNVYFLKCDYDSSLIFLYEAQKLSLIDKDQDMELSLMENFGNNYQMKKNYDLAESYYKSALKLAEKMENRYKIAEIFLNSGVLYSKQGKEKQAFTYFDKGLSLAEEIDSKYLKTKFYNQMSNYYEKAGDYKKALLYSRKHKNVTDTVFSIETEDKILKMKSDFEIYQIEVKKKILEQDLAISKDKIFRRSINLIIVIFLALIVIIYAIVLIRKLFIQKRINNILKNRISTLQSINPANQTETSDKLKDELEIKNKELTTNALFMIKVEETAKDLLDKLLLLKMNLSIKGKNELLFKDIENTTKDFLIGKGWDEFKYCFEQINSSFYENLDKKYPDLTQSDKRFAALLTLNLTTKEIAILTNRTIRGVETSKFRLKKKMRLTVDENIMEVLQSIK